MKWVLFVAGRLLARKGRSSGVSVLSALGIAAGVMTLVAVLGVMNGFQLSTIDNILELGSYHVRIATDSPILSPEHSAAIERLRDDPAITAAVPLMEIQSLARGFWPETQGVLLRIVPEEWLELDPGAAGQLQIRSGEFDLRTPGSIVVGSELARALGVRVSDPVQVMFIPGGGSAPREVSMTVAGVVQSGYLDYDRAWAFASFATARDLLETTEPVVIGIKLMDRFELDRGRAAIATATGDAFAGATVQTWREFNRGIFGALRVEKTMMTLLIGLIFIVVGANIFQSLRRSIFERAEDIAILNAIGAPPRSVQTVFVLEGAIIGVAGAVLGTMLGLFLAYNINDVFRVAEVVLTALASIVARVRGVPLQAVRIFSPAYFYLTDVPVEIFAVEIITIPVVAITTALSAAYVASRRLAWYRPSELLRDE